MSSQGKSAFPLLSLPAELRLKVYDHFVKLDDSAENFITPAPKPKIDWSLLRVNRQTRAEIIDHALRNNLWICVALVVPGRRCYPSDTSAKEDKLQRHLRKQSCVPWKQLSLAEKELFARNCLIVLTIKHHEAPEREQCHTHHFQFAFHPFRYHQLCQKLTTLGPNYSIKVSIPPGAIGMISSRPYMVEKIAMNLLQPLSLVNGSTRIVSEDENVSLIFRDTIADVQSYHAFPSGCIRLLHQFIANGDRAASEQDSSMAICYYLSGITAAVRFQENYDLRADAGVVLCMEGANESNTINLLRTHLYIKFSEVVNKLVVEQKSDNGKSNLSPSLLEKAIDAGDSAFKFAGISDQQRQAAHCARGMSLFNNANYNEQLVQGIGGTPSIRKVLEKVTDLFEDAARDFYYALQLSCDPPILTTKLQQLYEAACMKIGQPSIQFTIHEEEVPLIGQWNGDPRLRRRWSPVHFRFMRMMQQSELEGCPPVLTDVALAVEYSNYASDIAFTRDQTGRLAFARFN